MFELTPFRKHAVTYDPFRMLDDMEQTMFAPMNSFRTDIKDTGKAFVIEAELPGFSKEDIDVSLDENTLTITASHSESKEEKDEKTGYIHKERRSGAFRRCFDVSGVDADAITGSLDNGILTLTLPKKTEEEKKAKKIALN